MINNSNSPNHNSTITHKLIRNSLINLQISLWRNNSLISTIVIIRIRIRSIRSNTHIINNSIISNINCSSNS